MFNLRLLKVNQRLARDLFQKSPHLFGMNVGLLDGRPVFDDISFRTDDHGGADGPFHLFAVHHFLAESAVFLHDFGFGIGQQHERQFELLGEFIMRCDAILAHAQDDYPGFFESVVQLAEPASLLGSTRRVVLGIKKHHHGLALIIVLKGMRLAVVALQAERRRFFPD